MKVNVAYSTKKTSSFFPNKDKISKGVQSNVVYKFTCDQCNDHVYVGETIRHFSTRVQEHIRGQPPSDVSLYQHVAQQRQFSIVLRTSFTTIGEALIYNTIPKKKRLNNYRPLSNNRFLKKKIYDFIVIYNIFILYQNHFFF